ncbi:hypothetical protein FOMA001_g17905 [Fusarium oxysporum f. sp. matthiolae]|nr:hypothetical protein FOMA001_g17905 [Fusarium oxysporum f. sp. matthiolae]
MSGSCTDDEIMEELEAKDDLLRESESLKRKASDKQGPPRVQVINKIECRTENTYRIYLDEPWLVENGPYQAHLRCSRSIENLELYLERNKDIICLAYRNYVCCGSTPPIRNPAHLDLLSSEWVEIVAGELESAWSSLLNNDPARELQEMLDPGGDHLVQETRHPYLWWFHNRENIETWKKRLSQEAQDQIEAFQSYLRTTLGDEWDTVDAMLRKGKITAKYLGYIFIPGQIVIEEPTGPSITQWKAYTTTSWLNILTPLATGCTMEVEISAKHWAFDGNFQQVNTSLTISRLPSMTEEFSINAMTVFPMEYCDNDIVDSLRRRGQMFWKCRRRKYVCARDAPQDYQYNTSSSSRFMIDIATYNQMHPPANNRPAPTPLQDELGPHVMAQDDPLPDLGDEFYMCLPTTVYGFNMQKKDWGM